MSDVSITGPQNFAITAEGRSYVLGLREVLASTVPNGFWAETVISKGGIFTQAKSVFSVDVPADVRVTLTGTLADAVIASK